MNQGLLSALGVSHRCLDMIASICQSKGQLHAKLTGAGGGGFAFALVSIWKNFFFSIVDYEAKYVRAFALGKLFRPS